jgi:transcriptional regulator with XRE-family HTH domain
MSDTESFDDAVQVINGADGEAAFAALPFADFERLVEQARRGAGIDAAAEAIMGELNRLSLIPSEVVHRIAGGEHPVRVWRLHRGLKAVELAREAGISPGYLSEIETSKKDGTFRTMALIAGTLGVKLDDLMPVVDEAEIDEHRQEVQLRDIARLISEIESMVNGRSGFDSGAVRQGAQKLMRDAKGFMSAHKGNFGWLEGVVEKAEKIIEEINAAERDIVGTVANAQKSLSGIFSDSLSRAGLFPQGMARPRPERPAPPPPLAEARPAPPPPPAEAHEDTVEEDDYEEDDDDDPDDEDRDDDFENSRRSWFKRK